jgi:hypothetical protein
MTALALLFALPALAGWQEEVASARDACASDPAPCEVVDSVFVRESRAGLWFVQDQRLQVEHLPLMIGRLQAETEPQMRGAIATGVAQLFIDADPRWHAAWAELAATDPSSQVRSIFIAELRRAPLSAAGPGLRGALAHADPVTRRDAAAMMGRHLEPRTFVDDLIPALSDSDPIVRSTVVRALGHAGDPKAADAIRAAVLADDKLAGEAERALSRLQ